MIIVPPVLLIVWAVVAAGLLGLLAYRSQLTRYEEEQLFLDDNVNVNEQKAQTDIVRRVNQITPVLRVFAGATGFATAMVVGSIAWQAWKAIQ